jgi:HK97 gp10 family phage protein
MPAKSRRASRRAGATLTKSSIEGFDVLNAVLQELPRATQRNVLKKAARQALQPTFEQARDSAPVRTGKLRESVRMEVGMDDPGYRARARASFKAKGHARGVKKTKGGGNILASIKVGGRGAFHAPFVEFGTVKMAADPFLRPAFDSDAGSMVDRLRQFFGVEVRKAAARKAKKLAKG